MSGDSKSAQSFSPSLTVWYGLGLLLCVSFGLKLIWKIPFGFVEPALLAAFPMWWWRRRTARLWAGEWLLFAAFAVSTTLALRLPQLTTGRWIDAWSHTLRLLAMLLLVALVRSSSDAEKKSLCRGALHSMIFSLLLSVVIAAIGLHLLPNLLGVDLSFVDYQERFILRLGGLPVPRLFGLFDEPAPFGAYGIQCFVLFYACRDRIPVRLLRYGIGVSILVIAVSFSDQAWLAMLILLMFRPAAEGKRRNMKRWATAGLALAALAPYLFSRLLGKATEFSSYENGEVWGSSGAERIVNSVFALGISSKTILNFLFGIGPSLFGIFMAEYFPILGDRQQVQVLIPDLLCSVGIIGLSISMLLGWRWFKAARLRQNTFCLFALLLAVVFQSDFKSPSLAIAIGACLGGVIRHPTSCPAPAGFPPSAPIQAPAAAPA